MTEMQAGERKSVLFLPSHLLKMSHLSCFNWLDVEMHFTDLDCRLMQIHFFTFTLCFSQASVVIRLNGKLFRLYIEKAPKHLQ